MIDNVTELPMFPLSTVVFPHAELPLHVFEPRYRALIDDVTAGDNTFGTVLISAGSEVGGGDKRCSVGTRLRIEMVLPFDDGRSMMVARGIERIRVVEWLEDDPYPRALVETLPEQECATREQLSQASVCVRRVRMLLSELADGPCSPISLDLSGDAAIDSWMICALAPLGLFDAQQLLEAEGPDHRIQRLVELCCERISDLEALLSRPTD